MHHDFIALPEHALDDHARAQTVHPWWTVAKVVQHRAGIGLHKRSRDGVICVADVIEMRECVRAEAIENFVVDHCHETTIDALELQFARGRNERAGRVALRMNASRETGGCERSKDQSFHIAFQIQRLLRPRRSAGSDSTRSVHFETFSACHQCQSDNSNTGEKRWQQEDIRNAQECDPETARDAS